MKQKPMKPVKAWAMIHQDGRLGLILFSGKKAAERYAKVSSCRIARVLITEVPK